MHTEYKALFYHLISWNTENSSLKFAGVWNPHTYTILWPITKRAPHYHITKYASRREPSSSLLSYSHPICLEIFNANISESMPGNVSNWTTTNFVQRALRGQLCWDKTKCLVQCSEICQGNTFSLAKVSCIYFPPPTTLFFPLPSLTEKVWAPWQWFRNQHWGPHQVCSGVKSEPI